MRSDPHGQKTFLPQERRAAHSAGMQQEFRAQESSQANARALEGAVFLTAVLGEAPRKNPRPRAPHQTPGWLCSLWP